jgi:voltage-gated potassium channel
MKHNKYFDGIRFFFKGIQLCKHEIGVSLQVLIVLTLLFSSLLYLVEHVAQPDVYSNFWHNLLWSFLTFLDNVPESVIIHNPITALGKVLWSVISLLKIALFAVPTGLIANGFSEAMEQDKHQAELNEFRSRLQRSFSPTLARRVNDYRREKGLEGKFYMAPLCEPVAELQVKYHLDTKDILEACETFPEFCLANMASIQTEAENPVDRLVVLNRCLNTSYGCCIDRGSKVTIVVTSAHVELATEWFGYYLAQFGGFNFICRSIESDTDNSSYYNMKDNTDDKQQQDFYRDLKLLSQGEGHWNIYLLHQVTNINKGGNHIHFSSSMRDGKEPTIVDSPKYQALKEAIVAMFADYDFNFSSEDSDRYPFSENNIAYRLRQDSAECDSFTIRIGAHLMAKHTSRSLFAYRMAESIHQVLGGEMLQTDYQHLCDREKSGYKIFEKKCNKN